MPFITPHHQHLRFPRANGNLRKCTCFSEKPSTLHLSHHRSKNHLRMLAGDLPHPSGESSNPQKPQTHVTVEFARQALTDAVTARDGDLHAVAKSCAAGFADAFEQCYGKEEASGVFVVCGPGITGLMGLYCAQKLSQKGYEPSVHSVRPSKYIDVKEFCSDNDIALFDFVPSTVGFYYQVIVDALLGVGFDGGDIREPYWQVQEMLVSTHLPIASIDAPTGWDLTTGPRPVDVYADTFIKPHLLVSLGAPLACAQAFAGEYHFIAGQHLPQSYFVERGISVPSYPGNSQAVLFSSNSSPYLGNGAVYGKRGQFNATLFTKNPRRQWVDIDEDMDLWDELD